MYTTDQVLKVLLKEETKGLEYGLENVNFIICKYVLLLLLL